MQTLHAGCRHLTFSPRRRPLHRGAGWPKFNQLQMATTFTYKHSLVRIDAHNLQLSWQQTQTGSITIHCTAASAQRSK